MKRNEVNRASVSIPALSFFDCLFVFYSFSILNTFVCLFFVLFFRYVSFIVSLVNNFVSYYFSVLDTFVVVFVVVMFHLLLVW